MPRKHGSPAFTGDRGVGDPGLEPGTSSLSEKLGSSDQSSAVVKVAGKRGMLTLVSRLDTTAHDSLMHPICIHDPSVPVASCLLRPGPSTRLCKAVLHESVCPSPRATCQA